MTEEYEVPAAVTPSIEHPLWFHHMRKAGGTSIRQVLFEQFHKQSEISCLTRECTTYGVSVEELLRHKKKVYAGHIPFGHEMLNPHLHAHIDYDNQAHTFTALTNIRDPVSRFVSCIRYRALVKDDEMLSTKKDFTRIFDEFLQEDDFGFGCNNEIIRIMSGIEQETVINNLMHQNERVLVSFVELTWNNLKNSVVFDMFDSTDESLEIVEYWTGIHLEKFPHLNALKDKMKNPTVFGEDNVDPVIWQKIFFMNFLEILTFDAAKCLLKADYEAAHNNINNTANRWTLGPVD